MSSSRKTDIAAVVLCTLMIAGFAFLLFGGWFL